ncbi:conserved protein of unknown function [Pseudorhizobium banfieldiae]|uniref:Uncharacterized protein n=1 Tax=Pseudorhizobium banfieldiae TaxID=1125847 RepID=L0NLT4_9HYPH|nr:hypothetical protein [Pseudorhizobium banfieldiae]CAD6595862.1 hypothetical protein RNT25_00148 [arsenite-oxidising bacterium NT-25]CAD6602407.1 hypothetical protein RTCK_01108 [Rhizobium sp. TCK]CCF21741.1 conserved protein of unknown function [Pseudorhizobium banfieldiae]
MLFPTQQTAGLAATNVMQATLDSIEERRRDDQEKASGEKRDPVVEAQVSASIDARRARDKMAEALFGINNVDANELKLKLTERLAAKLGIDLEEDRSNFSLGRAIEEAIKQLGLDQTAISKLEDELGLKAAGVSLATVIAAIKNPYGDDNARLLEGLAAAANGGGAAFDVARVLQRLEDVADPKTLEELKLGPQGYDPTRVEDAQTRAERQKDIQALEASEKLEDVQDMQDVVSAQNDNAVKPEEIGEPKADAAASGAELILILGANAEQAKRADVGPTAEEPLEIPSEESGALEQEEQTEQTAEAIEEMALVAANAAPVLPIFVDDVGLYELLKRKFAA